MNSNNLNFNNGNKSGPDIDKFYRAFIMLFVILNGMAVGGVVRNSADLIQNGFQREKLGTLFLYIGAAIYTGMRAYQIARIRNDDNTNQKQR